MRAPIIVLTGPPGVGKSTIAPLVAETYARSAVVSGDRFFQFLHSGKIPPWKPESHQQNEMVTTVAVQAAVGYATAGWTTILEGIFGPWFLPTILAESTGMTLHYIVLQAPLATCVDRFAKREPDSSSEVVAKMHGEFDRALIEPRHIVNAEHDPTRTTRAVHEIIARQAAVLTDP